jgi:hypothetical protein
MSVSPNYVNKFKIPGERVSRSMKMLRDQIVAGCFSSDLRSKFVMEAANLTLPLAVEIARRWELTNAQSKQMFGQVKSLRPNPHKNPPHSSSLKGKCYRCGEPGHWE